MEGYVLFWKKDLAKLKNQHDLSQDDFIDQVMENIVHRLLHLGYMITDVEQEWVRYQGNKENRYRISFSITKEISDMYNLFTPFSEFLRKICFFFLTFSPL